MFIIIYCIVLGAVHGQQEQILSSYRPFENMDLCRSLAIPFIGGMDYKHSIQMQYEPGSTAKRHYFNDLLLGILRELPVVSIEYQIGVAMSHRFIHDALVLVDTYDSLQLMYRDIESQHERNYAYTTIFMSSVTSLDDDQLKRSVSLLLRMHTTKTIIVVEQANGEIVLVTYYPFSPHGCQYILPVVNNRYDKLKKRWENEKFRTNKLDNFHGCNITCAVSEKYPFITIVRNSQSNIVDIDGLQAYPIKQLAKMLNFKLKIYEMDAEDKRKTLKTKTNYYKKLFSTKANFSAGFYLSNAEEDKLQNVTSVAFTATHISMIINLDLEESEFEHYFKSMEPRVWLAILLTYTAGILVIFICSRSKQVKNFVLGRGNRFPYFNMFAIFLMGSAIYQPRRNFARYICVVWLLGTIVIRSTYLAGMYNLERSEEQHNMPHTLQDVQNYAIFAEPELYKVLIRDYNNIHLTNGSIGEVIALISNKPYTGFVGATVQLSMNKNEYSVLSKRSTRVLHMLSEVYQFQELSLKFPSYSFLSGIFERSFLRFRSHGFFKKWFDTVSYARTIQLRKQLTSVNAENLSINLEEFIPILVVFAAMIIMSVFTLYLEIHFHKK